MKTVSAATTNTHRAYHSPFGKVIGYHDDVYVSKNDKCIGKIFIPQDSADRFVIYYSEKHTEFKTLNDAVDYIVSNNERKNNACSN